jgi:hypothetical protein
MYAYYLEGFWLFHAVGHMFHTVCAAEARLPALVFIMHHGRHQTSNLLQTPPHLEISDTAKSINRVLSRVLRQPTFEYPNKPFHR